MINMRHYSARPTPPSFMLKAASTLYLVSALTVPFIYPIAQSRSAKKDGSWKTRPPIKFVPGPFQVPGL
ncbi:hypothetical protein M501DRAFT_1000375, partial [Patellaria atrata CBS 101060]